MRALPAVQALTLLAAEQVFLPSKPMSHCDDLGPKASLSRKRNPSKGRQEVFSPTDDIVALS